MKSRLNLLLLFYYFHISNSLSYYSSRSHNCIRSLL